MIKDLSIKPQTIKLLEENIDSKLSDIAEGFLMLFAPLIYLFGQRQQRKNKQMGLHQTKVFMQQKKPSPKQRDNQPTEWETIFANDKSDQGFIAKIYKELI